MEAFQVALRERNFHVLELLIGLTQMMVEGELLQLERIGRIKVTEADCMELVDRKTACLFSVCAKLGALVSGADSQTDRKSTRLNSSHLVISYAVFCLKKKKHHTDIVAPLPCRLHVLTHPSRRLAL